MSYIDRDSERAIDLVALQNFGEDDLHAMRFLLTRGLNNAGPYARPVYNILFPRNLAQLDPAGNLRLAQNLNPPQQQLARNFLAHLRDPQQHPDADAVYAEFMAMSPLTRFYCTNAARGGNTLSL
jgi:hypothetical protein